MFSFLDIYDFLFRPRREDRILVEGGPCGSYKSDLVLGVHENHLVRLIAPDRVTLAKHGEDFFGIARKIVASQENWVSVEYFGEVWFLFETEEIPQTLPKEVRLVAVRSGQAVLILPVSPHHPVYLVLSVDETNRSCIFQFPVKFTFGGRSIIYK